MNGFAAFVSLAFSAWGAANAIADPMAIFVNMNYADGVYCTPEEKDQGCISKPGELAVLEKNAISMGISKNNILIVPPRKAVEELKIIEREKASVRAALHLLNPALKAADLSRMEQKIREMGPAGLSDKVVLKRLRAGQNRDRKAIKFSRAIAALSPKSLLRYKSNSDAFDTAEKTNGSITNQIRVALNNIRKHRGTLDMLSISGHSIGNELFGERSNTLPNADVRGIVRDYPELVKEPRRIALPGCYTYTTQEFERWQDDLGVRIDSLIIGWDGSGRKRNDPKNWKYIDEAFANADKLDQAMSNGKFLLTEQEIRKSFRALSSFNANKEAAVSYCGLYFNTDANSMEAMNCGDQWLTLIAKESDIQDRFLAHDKIPEDNPPENTGSSPLRSFYTQLQEICPASKIEGMSQSAKDEMKASQTEFRDRTVRTIFWKNVSANFARCKDGEIQKLRKDLLSAGLPPLSLNGNSSRKEFIASYLSIMKKLKDQKNSEKLTKSLDLLEPLIKLDSSLPLIWVEENPICQ